MDRMMPNKREIYATLQYLEELATEQGDEAAAIVRALSQESVRSEALRAENMNIRGDLFALRFTEGCSNGCVELYVEDDGWYHLKATFDKAWLSDLARVALQSPARVAEGEQRCVYPEECAYFGRCIRSEDHDSPQPCNVHSTELRK